MNRRTIVVIALLASACSAAQAKVVCLKKSLHGPLRVRESCNAKEAKLGAFDAFQALLAALSVENGGTTIRLSGLNLQIVSGAGATDAPINGKGNLIIGYDEPRPTQGFCSFTPLTTCMQNSDCPQPFEACVGIAPSDKSGSHNIVIGSKHSYRSFGGLVAGEANAITAPYASVSGGANNMASGRSAAVGGGQSGSAGGDVASVSGGVGNVASGPFSSVSGGVTNQASGRWASVSGGLGAFVSGDGASVSGGFQNVATGPFASVSGGLLNQATTNVTSVCGGAGNVAGPGTPLFTFEERRFAQAASVCGGANNVANGAGASVAGGMNNLVTGPLSSIGGGSVPEVTGTNEWHAAITSGFPAANEY